MSQAGGLPNDKKLTVLCRVEPGCLGPDGKSHIEAFCQFAQQAFSVMEHREVRWLIVPRYDKSLAETQYQLSGLNLTYSQAAKYLSLFKHNIDEFETQFNEQLAELIDQFLGRD